MHILMSKGSASDDVERLRRALAKALGEDAKLFPSLQASGTPIDEDFDGAIRRWQAGVGLIGDGVVGPRCQLLLDLIAIDAGKFELTLNVGNVSRLFPATKPANIARYLPYIEAALGVAELTDRPMILGALGTIRAETEGFVPIAEAPSKFNTPPGGAPFSLYDTRAALGNSRTGDGERYRGRGFVQLTGKDNYTRYGQRIGVPLETAPDRANAPEVAAVLLALYLSDKATKFRQAIRGGDFAQARRLVNGGVHGLDRFKDVFERAATVWPAARVGAGGARRGAAAAAAAEEETPSHRSIVSRTRKDAADVRDRLFQPSAISLPDEFPPQEEVRQYVPAYTRAGLILDQGREGACTGFGLSCVINYLRWVKAGLPPKMDSVSPRMLYTLARRHDEYEGENYEGSSCRGALKGWFNHGVCLEPDWPYLPEKSNPATYGYASRAAQNTLGIYYRIDTRSITDVQAAIAQHRAVFVSAFTHPGWDAVPITPAPKRHADLPLIAFDGRRSETGGHAFALIGFNAQGFILQNSWGRNWGAGGFAVLGYLDWLAHAMDAWVVSLGVPGVIAGRLAVGGSGAAGLTAADRSQWWDTGLAYQHSVVLGNDGRVSRYLTEDEPPRKLQQQACVLPDDWFRRQAAARKRLVLYVHGGLNSEEEAIKRASAMGRYFTGNGCYPLFLVWKTGFLESVANLIADAFRREPARAGFGEWFTEQSDLLVEKSVGRPAARPLWSEMKENAGLAFAERRGGDLLLDAMQALGSNWGAQFELHLVGHSAGAIAIGHLLTALAARKRAGRDGGLSERVASVNLYAPACSVAFANRHYAGDAALMERLHLELLTDETERRDTVGPIYRKSLLYLVSNALEADLHTPILGLDRVNDESYSGWDGSSDTGEALAVWRQAAKAVKLEARTRRVEGPRIEVALDAEDRPVMQAATHGGFDNDIGLMTRTLERITGGKLALAVDDLRGF